MCVCACVSTCASGEHLCGVGGQQVSLRVMTTCVRALGYQGNRPTVQRGMFDMERPGTCKRTYFCFLSFSFSKRGVVPHSQHIHPPLKVIGKQSIVNSLNHYSQTFPVSGPLCTLTIHREPQRAFPYTYRL